MRSLIFFITLLLCITADAQTVEDKIFKKMCDCLSLAIKEEKGFNDEKFDTCVSSDSILNNEIEEYFASNDSLAGVDSYEFGKKFFKSNQVRLIHECDAWFRFIDSVRYDFLKEIDKKEQQILIDSLTKLISLEPGKPDLYQQRGLAYFSLLKTSEAKADFDKTLSLPGANSLSLYFRGWIAEINGNYDDAIKDYNLAKKMNDNEFLDTVIAIAERKKKEKK